MLEVRGTPVSHFLTRGSDVLRTEHLFSWPFSSLSGEGLFTTVLFLHNTEWPVFWVCLSFGPETTGEGEKTKDWGLRKTKFEDQTSQVTAM